MQLLHPSICRFILPVQILAIDGFATAFEWHYVIERPGALVTIQRICICEPRENWEQSKEIDACEQRRNPTAMVCFGTLSMVPLGDFSGDHGEHP